MTNDFLSKLNELAYALDYEDVMDRLNLTKDEDFSNFTFITLKVLLQQPMRVFNIIAYLQNKNITNEFFDTKVKPQYLKLIQKYTHNDKDSLFYSTLKQQIDIISFNLNMHTPMQFYLDEIKNKRLQLEDLLNYVPNNWYAGARFINFEKFSEAWSKTHPYFNKEYNKEAIISNFLIFSNDVYSTLMNDELDKKDELYKEWYKTADEIDTDLLISREQVSLNVAFNLIRYYDKNALNIKKDDKQDNKFKEWWEESWQAFTLTNRQDGKILIMKSDFDNLKNNLNEQKIKQDAKKVKIN